MRLSSLALPLIALSISGLQTALADGGAVLSQQTLGNYKVTLFGSPSPLRAGPADLSVMIQDAATGAPLLNRTVSLEIRAGSEAGTESWVPPCCSMKAKGTVTPATHASAQNKLLYAANVILPASGTQNILVRIDPAADAPFMQTTVTVAPPPPPLSNYWAYLALPPVAIAGFALNQRLRRRPPR